jgi:peptidoglycan/LPS O-acetylase OafA/YrhL
MSEEVPPARPAPPEAKTGLRKFLALDLLDNRYPALHGLRVLAIVSVIQYHVTWIFSGEEAIALDRGFVDRSLSIFFGMDLFFILSGFLIGSILLRSLDVHGTQNIKRFYLRRVFRTFPSYYVVLTLLVLLFPLADGQRAHLPYEYFYLTNFMPLSRPQIVMFWGWSLSLEEQFYLTVPLLFVVLHRLRTDRARIALLALIWSMGLVARLAVYHLRGPWTDYTLYDALYFRTYTRFDTIVMGILLAVVEMRYGQRIGKWLEHPFHRALLGMTSLACLWVLLRPAIFGEDHVQMVHVFAWGTLTSAMYFPALLLVLHGDGPFHRFFGAPIFRRLATLGYGVYLVHIPLIDHVIVPVAHDLEDAEVTMLLVWPVSLVVVTLLSFAIAYAMHVLIEKPSLRVRELLAA